MVGIREIISKPPSTPTSQFMHRDIHPVTTDVDQEEVLLCLSIYFGIATIVLSWLTPVVS